MPQTVHVVPHTDLIAHEVGHSCVCGPEVEPVFDDEGGCGWVYTHHSLLDTDKWIQKVER